MSGHAVIQSVGKGILLIVTATILVIFSFLGLLKLIDPEQANYLFYKELHTLAAELKSYKRDHGVYPSTVFSIRKSDVICITYSYKRCRKVFYKPSADLKDFRMAAVSFSWPKVLFYDPHLSMTSEEYRQLTQEQKEKLPYTCFYCEAYPEWYDSSSADDIPIYRKDIRIFSEPDKWPKLGLFK